MSIQSSLPCIYCRWVGESHGGDCPATSWNPGLEKLNYEMGWDDGRCGKPAVSGANKYYLCGYKNGEIAAEEAYNGFNPVFDHGQW